jgi:hypothetical protein
MGKLRVILHPYFSLKIKISSLDKKFNFLYYGLGVNSF